MKNKLKSSQIHVNMLRASRLHFLYALIMVGQLMLYDATKLQTPDIILQRWIVTAIFVFILTIIWYFLRTKVYSLNSVRISAFLLILLDVILASFSVYTQRGMASRAVFLFIIPLLTAAALQTKVAIYGALVLCITAYSTVSITYFVNHFNEGYKAELYGEVGFYSVMMALVAMFLWNMVRTKRKS